MDQKFTYMKSLIVLLVTSALLSYSFILPTEKADVTLTCKVNSCEKINQLHLYEFNGVVFKKVTSAPTEDFATYEFKMPATDPRFYYVGLDGNNVKPIILGTEESVELSGNCKSFKNAFVPNSKLNKEYQGLKALMDRDKKQFGRYMQNMQSAERSNNVQLTNNAILGLKKLENVPSPKSQSRS